MSQRSNLSARQWMYRACAVLVSILVALVIMEVLLRVVPIPGIGMGTRVFDPDIKLFKFAPGTQVIKTNINGQRIVRGVNDEGFLDKNHSKVKPDGVYRIGFFGDSFVEALQVPLEKTFFRIVENDLSEYNVETLAFGKSGHGTFHSLLKSRKYTPYYDLDMVVYVFVENDPGDHLEEIKDSSMFPYVDVKNGTLVTDDDRLRKYISRRGWKNRLQPIYNNSILAQTIYNRGELLMEYGVNVFSGEEDLLMSGKDRKAARREDGREEKNDADEPLDQNEQPSDWPAEYRQKAKTVGEKVLSTWAREVKSSGREYVILYVPRANQWGKPDKEQDSWKHWLKTYCEANGVEFIGPAQHFAEYEKQGKELYGDHFTEDGHAAFAEAFTDWFRANKQ